MICKYEYCTGLTTITIPNSVTDISAAFVGCTGLTSATIGNSVTDITRAFEECTGLTSIEIPNSVTTIGNWAFSGCTGLTSITIPNSVTTIGEMAFSGCSGLTSVEIPNSVTEIGGGAFVSCTGLTSVTIPNSVVTLGSSAFNSCSGLTSVTIPNSVEGIGMAALGGCSGLTSITIPNSVTSIGNYAFYSCSGLSEIVSLIEEPFALGESCWSFVNKDIPLYVPKGTKERYEATEGWNEFTNIIERTLAPMGEGDDVEIQNNGNLAEGDLAGKVVDNVYYNIPSEDGSYNLDDDYVVIYSSTPNEEVDNIVGKDVLDPHVPINFCGVIVLVSPGRRNIIIDAETFGELTLNVKVGDEEPIEKKVNGRQQIAIPYDATVSTYVYIYAGAVAGAKSLYATNNTDDALRIYGISIGGDVPTGITEHPLSLTDELQPITGSKLGIYTLQGVKIADDMERLKELPRGIYIVNGKKVAVK